MSATPRSARFSTPGEVVAILVASVVIWIALFGSLITLFITVFIPLVTLGGKADIPSDFPVYRGAQLQSAFATDLGDCISVDATWSSTDTVTTVVTSYEWALAGRSWKLTGVKQLQDGVVVYFESTAGLHREGSLAVQSVPYSKPSTQISLVMYKSGAHAGPNCHLPPAA